MQQEPIRQSKPALWAGWAQGLHDPLPLATIDSPTQHKLSSLDLEDSATQVLQVGDD